MTYEEHKAIIDTLSKELSDKPESMKTLATLSNDYAEVASEQVKTTKEIERLKELSDKQKDANMELLLMISSQKGSFLQSENSTGQQQEEQEKPLDINDIIDFGGKK